MDWAGKQHPIETVAEWVAPALLAAATGWAVRSVPLPVMITIAAALAAFAAGMTVMRLAGKGKSVAVSQFEPVELGAAEPEELLLGPADEVLVLDDPLVDVAPDSRVVRLFSRQDPTPGELVDRISDFLGDGRRPGLDVQNAVASPAPADASTALHAALANIRASLR